MECIPAIDIRGGQAVRLLRGDYSNETVFGDPLEQAQRFVAQGAPRLHVVDLDAARSGEPENRDLVLAIAAGVGVPVHAGGGVRSLDAAAALLDGGVARVVLGSVAIEDPDLVVTLAGLYPGRVLVGLDHRQVSSNGEISRQLAVHGWREGSGVELADELARLQPLPIAGVIVTNIERDGTLSGPDVDGLSFVLAQTSHDVYASGGVGNAAHLVALAALAEAGHTLAGVVVGRALVAGELSLQEAVAACAR